MEEPSAPRLSASSDVEVRALRQYYEDSDFLLSTEGIMKALAVLVCIVSSTLYLASAGCAGAPRLAASAGTVALVAAGGVALLYAGAAVALPLYAPQPWLFMDIIVSTVMGIQLLVTATLSVTFCELDNIVAVLHAPLGVIAAALIVGSAGVTYVRVTRRWDAARPAVEPPRPRPAEQDV